MEMSLSPPSEKEQNDPGKNILLLRRPRPPKQVLKISSPREGVTFKSPSPHFQLTTTPKAIMVQHRSLPMHNDLYRTDIMHDRSEFSIHPPHPKGPEFFPPGKVIFHAPTSMDPFDVVPDEIHLSGPEHTFTLDNFLIQLGTEHPPLKVSEGMISRQNYLKMTGWFAANVPTQEKINTLDLEVDYQVPMGRVPKGQILIGKFAAQFHALKLFECAVKSVNC